MHMLDLLALASFTTILPACTTAAFCFWHDPVNAVAGGRLKPLATCRRNGGTLGRFLRCKNKTIDVNKSFE